MTSETKAMTLRIAVDDAEKLRQLAFDWRVSQSDIIREALHKYLTRDEGPEHPRGVCDWSDCDRVSVMTTTPGGFRFCVAHAPRGGSR